MTAEDIVDTFEGLENDVAKAVLILATSTLMNCQAVEAIDVQLNKGAS